MSVSYLLRSEGLAYPTSARRGRFWGSAGGGLVGWAAGLDPTGLDWSTGGAWDMGVQDPGGAIPSLLAGGVALTPDGPGHGTLVAAPTAGYGLSGQGRRFGADDFAAVLPGLAGATTTHVRMLVRSGSALGALSTVGDPVGRHLIMDYTIAAGRVLGRLRDGASTILQDGIIGDGSLWQWYDVTVYDDGGSRRLDALLNGATATVSSAGALQGLGSGLVSTRGAALGGASTFDGDLAFLGVRQGTCSLSQHNAAINACFDGVAIDGRTWDAAWAAPDLPDTPGNWPALSGGVPLLLRTGRTYSTGHATPGVSAAAVGAARLNRAIRHASGSSYAFVQTDPIFQAPSGYSAWYRVIARDLGPGGTVFNRGTGDQDRLTVNSQGRAGIAQYPAAVGVNAEDFTLLDQFTLIDAIVDNAAGELRIYQQGDVRSLAITTPVRALTSDIFQILFPTTEILFVGMNADLSAFAQTVHEGDAFLLGAV